MPKFEKENNPVAYNKARRTHILQKMGNCTICPFNKGCNAPRSKRGAKKPKYKNKR